MLRPTNENYASMQARIEAAEGDRAKIEKCEVSLKRLYDAGIFNASEYKRLDNMLLSRLLKLLN